jgi:hypothetical protein
VDKKEKQYYLVDHANKRGEKLRKNPNRASLRAARSRRVLPSELGRDGPCSGECTDDDIN